MTSAASRQAKGKLAVGKLALGTVQFGLAYGVTHGGGRVPESELRAILAKAKSAGIDTLDTAAAYGDAEDALGKVVAAQSFRIITKTQPFGPEDSSPADVARIEARFFRSLETLAVPAIESVLVHTIDDLLGAQGERLWHRMESWRSQGLVRRIGVSIYDSAGLNAVLARFVPGIVQLPLNVLDQRLLRDGSIARLARRGIAVHARSLFLQGLLLQHPGQCPAHLARLLPDLERWWARCADHGIPPLAAALRFGLECPEIEKIVVGVHTTAHLDAIISAAQTDAASLDWPSLAAQDSEALDPRRWPKA